MSNFSPAKKNRHFDPLTSLNELTNVSDLMHDIVRIRARSHFDFLDLHNGMFLWPMRFLLLLIAELAVIHHPANRRLSIRRHLHQIQLLRVDQFEGFIERHDTELLTAGADDPYFTGANLMIDPRFSSDKPPPIVVRRSYSYASPLSCAN